MPQVAVIGIGNILLQDDGVGIHVVNQLKQKYQFEPKISIIDGGTSGMDLLPAFQEHHKILIIDTVNFEKDPGHIETLENEEILHQLNSKTSLHHLGLSDLLSVLKLLGKGPTEICLIGIQPFSIQTGLYLSDKMTQKVDPVIKTVINKLKEWGVHKTYVQPTYFIDSDSPEVIQFTKKVIGGEKTAIKKAIKMFDAVRDGILYDPYQTDINPAALKASATMSKKKTFCVPKAVLLAAMARVEGIPSRLGFADVKNHLSTERLRKLMQTDIFIYHGYTELFLENKWVKATPAFNLSLCERFGVKPLEFDGRHDALFHEFDHQGNRHMEYIRDRGHFADLPYKDMVETLQKNYPLLFSKMSDGVLGGSFEEEVSASSRT